MSADRLPDGAASGTGRDAEFSRRRFAAEEVSGIGFAFKARLITVAAIAVWCLVSVHELARLIPYLVACVLVIGNGLLVYLARQSQWMMLAQGVGIVLDMAVLVAVLLFPGQHDPGDWALQVWVRRGIYFYLVVFIALNALSYSPLVVLVSGALSIIGLIAAYAYVLAVVPGGIEGVRIALMPHGVAPTAFLLHQVVLLCVCSGLIAAAVWRARRYVERIVSAERERSNLARYFSPNLVNRLAAADRRFEAGEARRVAVLFVDIVGFTRLVEGLPPDRTVALLRAFHKRMARQVFDHHGTLDKFIGDGLMATFGTPEPAADDVARAVACALDMVETIEQWNVQRLARGYPTVEIAVGIHVGAVVLGTIGSPERLEFTAVGDTVNIASRLERSAREHDAVVMASDEVIVAARNAGLPESDLARFEAIGPVSISGRDGPIDAWAVRRGANDAAATAAD